MGPAGINIGYFSEVNEYRTGI